MTSDWPQTDFAAWFEYHDPYAGRRRVTLGELVDGELAAIRARLVDGGTPAKAAAKYLAGWFAGLAGRSVGYAVLAADAWFELEAGQLRRHVHPDGWADRLELGAPRALVPHGHPWDDAEVVADEPPLIILTGGTIFGEIKIRHKRLWEKLAKRLLG